MKIGAARSLEPRNPSNRAKLPASQRPRDSDWYEAGELLEERGLTLSDHALLQENVATCLSHRLKGRELPTGRWETKLERDLAQPYKDAEVLEYVDELQSSLKENLASLPSYPKSIYITGSFSKGRLGKNSSLNAYALLPKDDFGEAFETFQTRHQAGESAKVFPLVESHSSFNKAMLMVEGSSVKISTEDLDKAGYLKGLYQEVLSEPLDSRREVNPRMDGLTGKMWRSKFERETFHFKLMRWALASAGALSRVPLVGSLVESAFSAAITQNHR